MVKKTPAGFTLIELVIVIIIIGIVYLASIKTKGGKTGEVVQLYSVKNQIVGAIKTAQINAIQYQRHYKIVFPYGSNFYLYTEEVSTNTWILDPNATTNFTDRIQITSTTLPFEQIIFDKKGVPYEDPSFDLPSQIDTPLANDRYIYLYFAKVETQTTINISPETGYSY